MLYMECSIVFVCLFYFMRFRGCPESCFQVPALEVQVIALYTSLLAGELVMAEHMRLCDE